MLDILMNFIGMIGSFLFSVLTIVTDGLGFLISIFTYIPSIIIFNFFAELPFYFQYGLYSLFCVLVFILVIKLISFIFIK